MCQRKHVTCVQSAECHQSDMAQEESLGQDTFTVDRFKDVQLLKNQTLGIGSYGKVCKAKCDGRLCAAKIIHETLLDRTVQEEVSSHREHRLPFKRFQQECEFMSALKHPNIVQYLGTYQDPETGLPVLLMELMDDSLTRFLERAHNPIPYHVQVNLCHDITCAISYLHSNGIIHRDLSSNNVLLCGNMIAKVTDFGMAKLSDANPHIQSHTMVPGTDAYMPPEAVQDQPVYTAKIDCFAIGTLIIQILTRQFPKPGDRRKSIQIDHPQLPGGIAYVNVPEIERRQSDISQVDSDHPLLPIALDCLKDSDVERPSSQELYRRVSSLKETSLYQESIRNGQQTSQSEKDNPAEREEQVRELQQQIEQKDDIIRRKNEEIEQLIQKYSTQILDLQETVETQSILLKEKEHTIQLLTNVDHRMDASQQKMTLKWKRASNAPERMSRKINAVANGDQVYFRNGNTREMYAYDSTNCTWNHLPNSQTADCALAVINDLLTTVGGEYGDGTVTNKLLSLTGEASSIKWEERFSPMPTSRSLPSTASTKQALIVAGGYQNQESLTTVEVMHISTHQWSTAAHLPQPLHSASITICRDRVYMLGGYSKFAGFVSTNSVYTCSLADLFLSCRSRTLEERCRSLSLSGQEESSDSAMWNKVADLPLEQSTCVTLNGRLLAVGGRLLSLASDAVYIYQPISDTWDVLSHMTSSRYQCFVCVLPGNQLMVVGGYKLPWPAKIDNDSVEIATIEHK